MAFNAGDIITDSVYVELSAGVPSTLPAATVFSQTTAYAPDNSQLAVTITDLDPPGLYEASFQTTADQPGTYTILLVSSETGRAYLSTYEVYAPATSGARVDPGGGISRGQIRRECATELGDNRQLIATHAGSGLTDYRDDARLTDEMQAYRGSDIVFTNDPLLNLIRYVAGSDGITRTLTVEPDLPQSVPVGATAELYNLLGMGCTVFEWNSFINAAIKEVQDWALIPVTTSMGVFTQDTTIAWGWTDGYYTQSMVIPDTMRYASRISYVRDGRTYYPPRASLGSHDGWRIDDLNGLVIIEGDLPHEMNGATVSITGFARPEELDTDQDRTTLNPKWLYPRVQAMALTRIQEKGVDHRADINRLIALSRDNERSLRPRQLPANTVPLWGAV